MTVQTSSGQIQIGTGDFIRTDRGVTWAIKCRDIDGSQFVQVYIQSGSSWTTDSLPESALDNSFDLRTQEYPVVMDWFTGLLIPKLNAWLAKKFPATAQPETRFEEADQLINTRLAITVNSDGTLTASLK